MRRFLLDTNAAAHCVFRRRGVHDRERAARAAGNHVGIGLPVLGELYAGVEYSATRDKNLDILERNVRLLRLWPFTADAAKLFGKLYADLRRKGRIIQQVDLQIAAIAFSLVCRQPSIDG